MDVKIILKKSFTTEVGEHIPCGYSMSTIWTFDGIENKHYDTDVEIVLKKLRFFKGYLCYKMIPSKNVSFDAQVENFLFFRNVMFCSQDIQVFVFLTIP